MMVRKAELFNDPEKREEILQAETPGKAKALGREVRGFDQATWERERLQIVLEGNMHKFNSNPAFKQFLLNTGERVLVEASPVDPIWGVGMAMDNPKIWNPREWRGTNHLGFVLMETRDRLRSGIG